MHKDDQMTPKERAFALFAGKPVDRMPIKHFFSVHRNELWSILPGSLL